MQRLLLVHVIFALLIVAAHTLDQLTCGSTGARTVKLNSTTVLRTWQPASSFCPWWQKRLSVNDDSGPRWLVLELWRAMWIEQISVQSLDGEWQTAGAVGSHVSALGAASLPLELLLEDPCSARWEVMQRIDAKIWRSLPKKDSESHIPVSFIMLIGSASLNLLVVQVSGKVTPLKLKILHPLGRSFNELHGFETDHQVTFTVSSCVEGSIECFKLQRSSGRLVSRRVKVDKYHRSTQQNSRQNQRTVEFKLNAKHGIDHGSLLDCRLNNKTVLVETITTKMRLKTLDLTVPPVLLRGRVAKIILESVSFPQPLHSCKVISKTSHESNLKMESQRRWAVKIQNNITALRLQSIFTLNVSSALLYGEIACSYVGSDSTTAEEKYIITKIAEPCATSVDLGSSPYWIEGQQRLIQITSRYCTIWSATHTCWLTNTSIPMRTEPLIKINESQFTSIHQVEVSRWMAHSDWSVKCRVNQSGVEYEDVESTREQKPQVFSKSDRTVLSLTADHYNGSHLTIQVSSSSSSFPVSRVDCNFSALQQSLKGRLEVCQFAASSILAKNHVWTFSVSNRALVNGSQVDVSCCAFQLYQGKQVFLTVANFTLFLEQRSDTEAQKNDIGITDKDPIPGKIEIQLSVLVAGAVGLFLFLCLTVAVTWRIAFIRAQRNLTQAAISNREISCPYEYPSEPSSPEHPCTVTQRNDALSGAETSVYDYPMDELNQDSSGYIRLQGIRSLETSYQHSAVCDQQSTSDNQQSEINNQSGQLDFRTARQEEATYINSYRC